MIEVEGLTKRYGPVEAVKDLSFKVEAGDVLGFLGPNGAGKTTTMRILTGYMPPTSGVARIAGHNIAEQTMEVKKKIGYLPERPPLYGYMTVEDYLLHIAELKRLEKSARKPAVERAIERTKLMDVRGRLISHLSKGYQQRIGIAQAILHDPQVLILDEPTIGLDPRQIVEIRDMIRGLAGKHTIILSTHILSEVSQICNRIIIINHGKIIASGTLEELQKQMGESEWFKVKVKKGVPANKLKSLEGVEVEEVKPDYGSYLEDMFLKIVESDELTQKKEVGAIHELRLRL